MKYVFVTIIGLFIFSSAIAKTADELTVYSYSALLSKWGPGEALKQAFEKKCDCSIKYIAADDGATLIRRIKLEGAKTKADVALGFDSNMGAEALANKIFVPSEVVLPKNMAAPMPGEHRNHFVPFDYGWLAIMYDSKKIKMPPKNMDDLLNRPEFAKSLLIEDPRTSAPGLALLFWLKEIYKGNWEAQLSKLKRQTLTVSPGWTEAYGLFTKGEAPLVVSYTTSEIYHRVAENSERYRAAIFPAHYAITEYAAITSVSKKATLARNFLNFLLTPEAQKIVAENNWMYPAIGTNNVPGLHKAFTEMLQPAKALIPIPDSRAQKELVAAWLRSFR
jgi:thiamine transport system substrate-binding protein